MRNTAIGIFILLALLLMACSDDEVTGSEVDEQPEEVEEEAVDNDETDESEKEESDETSEEALEEEEVAVLPLTIEEIYDNFDRGAEEFELSFRANRDAEVEDGAIYDTQNIVTDSDYVSMFATITKDGGIVNLTMIGVGDGTAGSGLEILGAIGSTIAAVQPELTPEERGEILTDLGILGGDGFPEDMTNTIRDNIKYSFSFSDLVGAMFIVESAE